jgi:hypothetical protein
MMRPIVQRKPKGRVAPKRPAVRTMTREPSVVRRPITQPSQAPANPRQSRRPVGRASPVRRPMSRPDAVQKRQTPGQITRQVPEPIHPNTGRIRQATPGIASRGEGVFRFRGVAYKATAREIPGDLNNFQRGRLKASSELWGGRRGIRTGFEDFIRTASSPKMRRV